MEYHDVPYSGHRGIDRTKQAIAQTYWWPGLDTDVKRHVMSCPQCQRNKPTNAKPDGLLQPLPIPTEVWESVSMDLITQLPTTRDGLPTTRDGHDAIVVFVDRLSKMTHFAPTHTTASAEDIARLFVATVFRQPGLPSNIVSDREPLLEGNITPIGRGGGEAGTHLYMSTAYPSANGWPNRAHESRSRRVTRPPARVFNSSHVGNTLVDLGALNRGTDVAMVKELNDKLQVCSVSMTPRLCGVFGCPSFQVSREITCTSLHAHDVGISESDSEL